MKRTLVAALILGLLAGALAGPTEAAKKKRKKKKKTRTVEQRYENPTFGVAGAGLCVNCPSFVSGRKEIFAKVTITDDVSPIGYVEFSYDSDGDGVFDTGETICGETEEPISIPAATEFVAFPYAVPGPGCVGASIAGSIKVKFSNLP